MKANPYVYPSDDFKYLLKKGKKSTVKNGGAKSLEYFIKMLQPLITFTVNTDKSKTLEEQIIDIFTDERICYGDKENILSEKATWVKKLRQSISKGQINLTILGFPFKIPVQLKTNRKLPDAGEVASLLSLFNIVKNVERVTKTKTVINIFAEEGFAKLIDLQQSYADKYFEYLLKISSNKVFEGRVKIYPISQMEQDKRFGKFFNLNTQKNINLFKRKDKDYIAKHERTAPVIFRIINTLGYDDTILEEVYSSKTNNKVTSDAQKVRKFINERLPLSIAKYFAYLKTRDDLNYLERKIKNPLTLSVSPKPGRLGVFPISKSVTKLPYHGIPVFDKGKKRFYIDYLVDLKKQGGKFTGLNWSDDFDINYFLYIKD